MFCLFNSQFIKFSYCPPYWQIFLQWCIMSVVVIDLITLIFSAVSSALKLHCCHCVHGEAQPHPQANRQQNRKHSKEHRSREERKSLFRTECHPYSAFMLYNIRRNYQLEFDYLKDNNFVYLLISQ